MSSRTAKRLLSELTSFQSDPPSSSGLVSLGPASDDDLFKWIATLKGPPDTPYFDGTFTINVSIPASYPSQPPKMTVQDRIFHPNIHIKTGEVCLDILKDQWSPVWTIASACLAFQSLLAAPEPSSPLNVDAANLIRCGDTAAFESIAKINQGSAVDVVDVGKGPAIAIKSKRL
ncbi:hypothetical protein MNV49_003528 [Pseudohyphozyma bogoriensis]|nr:hypothetical protein MNV49_003528 [Pseudohyphozyma bogoriensis]